jgi:hypothetical protein
LPAPPSRRLYKTYGLLLFALVIGNQPLIRAPKAGPTDAIALTSQCMKRSPPHRLVCLFMDLALDSMPQRGKADLRYVHLLIGLHDLEGHSFSERFLSLRNFIPIQANQDFCHGQVSPYYAPRRSILEARKLKTEILECVTRNNCITLNSYY